MAREFAKHFYKSAAWQKCRAALFIAKHGLCDRCGGPGKIVHHTVYLTPENINNPNITLNHDLLELHCQDCHNKEHHGSNQEVVVVGLMFDSNGDLVRRD
jgi:5-methylcytosine-specific restriction endonuclease McrA